MPIDRLKRVRRAMLHLADRAQFDWRYGTETSGFVEAGNIHTGTGDKSTGFDYQPTDAGEFRRIIRHIPPPHEELTFVDFGCGKGRVLLLAAQAGFRRIVGVEFSPALAACAEKNIAIFQHRVPQAQIQVAVADALEFPLPEGDCVLYFFNPFGMKMMERMSENLLQSHTRKPRRFFVALWHCSRYYSLFDCLPFLRPIAQAEKRLTWLTQSIYEWAVYGPNSSLNDPTHPSS